MTDPAAIQPPDPPAELTDVELRIEFALLTARNREIKREMGENTKRLEAIQARVVDTFVERQERAVDLIGVGNLHLIKQFSVKVRRFDGDYSRDVTQEERDAAAEALRAAGLHNQIKPTFNLQSIKGLYKEWDEQKEHPPPELEGAFLVDTSWKLGLNEPS